MKSDTAMLDTLSQPKRLMADISASAERRAELMMRDARLRLKRSYLSRLLLKLNDSAPRTQAGSRDLGSRKLCAARRWRKLGKQTEYGLSFLALDKSDD